MSVEKKQHERPSSPWSETSTSLATSGTTTTAAGMTPRSVGSPGGKSHRVWDTGIIERASGNESRCLADLVAMDTPEARQKAQGLRTSLG